MPAGPRREIIDNNEVGVYHCFNRCVRAESLLRHDLKKGGDYHPRKDWLLSMLTELAGIFSIDILKYAIMDNHLHLILRNRPDLVRQWSDRKVLRRVMQLFPQRFRRSGCYVNPSEPLPKQLVQNKKLIQKMRARLSDISWLMKVLQERIARHCNRLDGVSGHFWAGRFKSERLLDDAAVLACSMYIDLNPIRARMADRPERSKYTSAYDRIRGMLLRRRGTRRAQELPDRFLVPLNVQGDYANEDLAKTGQRASNKGIFEMTLDIYLKLLDTVGRMLRSGKRGVIPNELASIVERIGLRAEFFVDCVETYETWARPMVGAKHKLREAAKKTKRKWLQGLKKVSRFFRAETMGAAS